MAEGAVVTQKHLDEAVGLVVLPALGHQDVAFGGEGNHLERPDAVDEGIDPESVFATDEIGGLPGNVEAARAEGRGARQARYVRARAAHRA